MGRVVSGRVSVLKTYAKSNMQVIRCGDLNGERPKEEEDSINMATLVSH